MKTENVYLRRQSSMRHITRAAILLFQSFFNENCLCIAYVTCFQNTRIKTVWRVSKSQIGYI